MWWKIYFWIFGVLSVIGVLALIKFIPWNFADILIIVSSVLTVLALYSYVYQKTILTQQFWKYFFLFTVITSGLDILYNFTTLQNLYTLPEFLISKAFKDLTVVDYLIGLAITLPAYYANYKLAYLTPGSHAKSPKLVTKSKKKGVKKRK